MNETYLTLLYLEPSKHATTGENSQNLECVVRSPRGMTSRFFINFGRSIAIKSRYSIMLPSAIEVMFCGGWSGKKARSEPKRHLWMRLKATLMKSIMMHKI